MWRVQMQDDPEAFGELVRRWEGPIQRLCHRMIGDAGRSQDLSQEVFARLFARRKVYQPGAKFSTYLWRIALNLCYDELRRACHRREVLVEDPEAGEGPETAELAGEDPGPAEALARQETGAAVRHAVLALPEAYRAVVILRHYENLKFREIAEVLSLPEGTVKTRMAEALNRLARRLRPALAPAAPRPPEPPEPPEALPVSAGWEDNLVETSGNADLAAYALGRRLHGAAPALVVSPARAEAGEVAQVEEDLAVMSRILEKAVGRASGREGPRSVLGINLSNPLASRQLQSLYLEGYGVLFVLNVRYPLLAGPAKEEGKEEKPQDTTWEQTKRELFGGGQTSVGLNALLTIDTDRTVEEYDAGKVESLKKGLVEALKNGANIRHLKDDDSLAVVVLGPPAGQPTRGEARSESGRSSRRAQATPAGARLTTLAIRAKKSEVDAFAQGKLTAEEFARKSAIALY